MMKDLNRSIYSKRMLLGIFLYLASIGGIKANPESPAGSSATRDLITPSPQQSRITVRGTVLDDTGEPVIGANVVEKGTTNGQITDLDGQFSIQVPSDGILVISYVGYKQQEVSVRGQTTINITLQDNTELLDEVVVVGYGTQKKVNLTGAVSSVNFEQQALSRPITNVSSALAGLSAGVQVMQGSGKPGEDSATIRVRGHGSMNNNDPIYIIDGMEGVLDAVNPQDIESITILKDAASASIYGSRAANGVILVTTKKGKAGKLNVSYTGRISYAKPTNLVDHVTDYVEYMNLVNEAYTNQNKTALFSQTTIDKWAAANANPNGVNENGVPNWLAYPNTDWQRVIFDHGVVNDHNVSVNGGTEKTRFLMSVGYLDNPGVVDNTGIKRYSLRANVEADITKWLTVGMRTFASMEDADIGNFSNANNYLRQTTPGLYPYYDGYYGSPEAPEESNTANNLLVMLNGSEGQKKKSRFNTTLFSRIEFIKGLYWDFNFNYQRRWDENTSWTNSMLRKKFSEDYITGYGTSPDEMTTYFYNYGNYAYTLENLLRYSTTIDGVHDIGALLGYNEYYYYEYNRSATKKGLIDQTVHTPGSATEMQSIGGSSVDRARRSWFGRVNYAYKSKYLLEVNLRYDGHSRYHSDHRWGLFPAVSAGWRISEEAFMETTRSWLDNLKIRASWGKLGQDGGSDVGDYEYQSTYGASNYSFGGKQAAGLASTSIANSVLTWESIASTDIGLDATFLTNRLSFEFDYYYKFTDGILYRPTIYLTAGSVTAPRLNIAEVTNKGVEFTLNWRDRIGKVDYSIGGNFSYNKNRVHKYKGEYEAGWVTNADGERVYQTNLGDVSTGSTERVVEGKTMYDFYLKSPYKGSGTYYNSDGSLNINGGPKDGMIRTEADMEWVQAMIAAGYEFLPGKTVGKDKIWYGDYIYADANGDGVYGDSYDNEFQGVSKNPKYTFGFQMSAAWKGFDIFMNWAGNAGFKLYWASTAGYNSPAVRSGFGIPKEIADNHYFYDPENPNDSRTNINGKYGRLTEGESGSQNVESSTNYLFNGNFLKLKNLTIGYTLPSNISRRIYAENIRVYLSGENLWCINSFPGQDPEMGAKHDYTSMKQFAFGVNVTF